MVCGSGCICGKQCRCKEASVGFAGADGGGAGQAKKESEGFQIAGLNWWIILLFIGIIYSVFNWNPK